MAETYMTSAQIRLVEIYYFGPNPNLDRVMISRNVLGCNEE